MKKILSYIKKNKGKSILGGVVLLIIILIAGINNSNTGREEFVVTKRSISDVAVLSGTVSAESKADLGFAASGRINKIYVTNGEQVKKGRLLAQLEIGDLIADWQIKEAQKRSTLSDLQGAKQEIEKVKAEQDEFVKSAYRTLLTDDLTPVASSTAYSMTTPVVSGAYNGAEGEYKIIIGQHNPTIEDYYVRTFGLEDSETIVDKNYKTALGTKGLYLTFPDGIAEYTDTIWYLSIPNKKSSSYLSNLNAYEQAKKTRDARIDEAQSRYESLLASESSGVSLVEAQINKIDSEIRKNSIYAPFDGVVGNIEKKVGENASVGEHIVSVGSSTGQLSVLLEVPELDVAKLQPDLPVEITLDAFGGEKFDGKITTINSSETEISGVPVYKAYVEIPNNPLIRNGMSAYGKITLSEKENVIAVPLAMLTLENGKYYAEVVNGKKTEKREVTIGIKGTDNFIEILSGLVEGETIVR